VILDLNMQIRALQSVTEQTMERVIPLSRSGIHSVEAIVSEDGNALVFVAVGAPVVQAAVEHLKRLNDELRASAEAKSAAKEGNDASSE
jgi:hypothetical protein